MPCILKSEWLCQEDQFLIGDVQIRLLRKWILSWCGDQDLTFRENEIAPEKAQIDDYIQLESFPCGSRIFDCER